jgi:glycosyltransferase involved in cell wall biosynthesis
MNLKVLVISDSYLPKIQGGAELSLAIVLSHLVRQGVQVAVATPGDQPAVNGPSYTYEGVDVYHFGLPQSGPLIVSHTTSLQGSLAKRCMQPFQNILSVAKYLTRFGNTPIPRKLKALLLSRSLFKQGKGYWNPMMDSDYDSMTNSSKELTQIIDKLKPDIVHADNYRAIMLVGKSDIRGVATVAHVRDNRFFCPQRDQPMNISGKICHSCDVTCTSVLPTNFVPGVSNFLKWDRDFRRSVLSRFSLIISTSRFLDAQISSIVPDMDTSIVPNPSDKEEFVHEIQKGITTSTPPIILLVGMINANKGQRNIVKWIEYLREEVVDFRIVLAGRGQLGNLLLKEAHKKGLADYLELPGFLSREELYRYYAKATLVIAPNVWPEPFGRVPLEAGLSRKPIIAYGSGGPCETIIHRETGVLVSPRDEKKFLEEIVSLLKNPEQQKLMGAAAQHRVRSEYTVKKSAESLGKAWIKAHSKYQESFCKS